MWMALRKAMHMFDSDHYVPILRGKVAEYEALGDTTDQTKGDLTPFIELPPIAWDPDGDDSGTPDRSIAKVAGNLARQWGPDLPLFLELGLIPSEPALGGGVHPVEFVFDDARTKGLEAIPVTSPGRDDAFQAAIQRAVETDGRGVCIRLTSEDFEDVVEAIGEADELLAQFGVDHGSTDLLLDFGEVPTDQAGPMVLAAQAVIDGIPDIEGWRTLTWAGTAFPSVQNFAPDSVNTSARGEWSIWQSLRGRDLPRIPSFGDYTINGVQSDYDVAAAYHRSSPNLRYTAEDIFIIWKARHPKHGHEQFNGLCRSAVSHPEFRGGEYSVGDAYIERCAADEDGPGMAIQWRKCGVNHHLTAVADQIANLPSP